jgi:diguanylate cyclase (GGDEF)-like protein
MPKIRVSQGEKLERCVEQFKGEFNSGFLAILQNKISYFQNTQEVLKLLEKLTQLDASLTAKENLDGALITLPDDIIPCLKRVLLTIRRHEATNYERAKGTTIHPELINNMETKLKPLDEMINQKWFQEAEPMKIPRLTDYLSVQQVEEHWHINQENSEREYDEKFHILQAPKYFLKDLNHSRWKCELRGTSVVVVQIDIDDFKRFNSKYGHVEVDRRILPPFMRVLEAHVFSHGYAYRYGGDEYVLLLPNLDYELAGNFLELLRKKVEELQYPGINDKTTVSIGFCYLDSDSYLTDREAEERANKAMSFAKQQGGKNCVATFLKSRFDDDSLRIVSPI